jgi:hypothetical protein
MDFQKFFPTGAESPDLNGNAAEPFLAAEAMD